VILPKTQPRFTSAAPSVEVVGGPFLRGPLTRLLPFCASYVRVPSQKRMLEFAVLSRPRNPVPLENAPLMR
jgi:hypothetical protein